jgi:hypothetical protein
VSDKTRISTKDFPRRLPVENPSLLLAGKTRVQVSDNPAAGEPKAASKKVRRTKGPPEWDFKKHGLLFSEDIEEAQELKRENPAAFNSSARAQKIVAYVEDSLRWQVARGSALEKSLPRPFRDLRIARDRSRKPKERFAALDRFARLVDKIPLNVVTALFAWLDGGPKSEVAKALDRTVVTLKVDPKTGALAEANGRGRKRGAATIKRIELAARLSNDGLSKRKMATELFPHVAQGQAYARTRDFFLKYRYAIELMAHCLRRRSQSSR